MKKSELVKIIEEVIELMQTVELPRKDDKHIYDLDNGIIDDSDKEAQEILAKQKRDNIKNDVVKKVQEDLG